MKVFALSILYKGETKARLLKGCYEVTSFGYFQRSTVKEFMEFTSRIIIERSSPFSRSSVKEQDYMCHVYLRGDSLGCVMVADHEYPQRVAHTLLSKVLDDFKLSIPPEKWATINESEVIFPQIEQYLKQSQNPQESDAMTKIQNDLDETKIILHNTIEAVLDRGEKLDDLVEKSEGLSTQSKAFYKTVKPRKHPAPPPPSPIPPAPPSENPPSPPSPTLESEEPLVGTRQIEARLSDGGSSNRIFNCRCGSCCSGDRFCNPCDTGSCCSGDKFCNPCDCSSSGRAAVTNCLRATVDTVARKTNQCCVIL